MAEVYLYDTTLRDGAQQEGISLSLDDKLKIKKKLDEAGSQLMPGDLRDLNKSDGFKFNFKNGSWLLIRFSVTESTELVASSRTIRSLSPANARAKTINRPCPSERFFPPSSILKSYFPDRCSINS